MGHTLANDERQIEEVKRGAKVKRWKGNPEIYWKNGGQIQKEVQSFRKAGVNLSESSYINVAWTRRAFPISHTHSVF